MIKFLKKFKDKILIALACSFIGIGTLLNNTIETKAYSTNQFSYTLTYSYTSQSGSRFYTLNEPIVYNGTPINLSNYVYIFNLSVENLPRDTTITNSFSFNGSNYSSTSIYIPTSYSDSVYTAFGFGSYNFNLYNDLTTISIYFSDSSIYSNLLNFDLIPRNDLQIQPYVDVYTSNINNQITILQSQYDSLQAEYTYYQNTHAYTNEQYSALMSQNVTLTQQIQSLQSQYDTYVNLHCYTNEQYETLLANYNSLQNMYSNLQASYLALQQQYENLALSVAPFTSSKWNNRTGSLNGVTYDMQNEYRDSLVSFEKTYLFVYPRDSDVFDSFSDSTNTFVLTAYCNDVVTLSSFNVIANLSHLREEYFQIDFYLDNSLVYSTIDFDNDMGEDDSNTISVDRFLQFNQITVTVVFTGVDSTIYGLGSYFNAVVGTWQNGYDYAVGQLMPQINQLEQDLQQSNAQQQVKYNEGFNAGFDSRIILNHYTE